MWDEPWVLRPNHCIRHSLKQAQENNGTSVASVLSLQQTLKLN